MLKKKVTAIAFKGFALLAVLSTAHHTLAQDATTPYPKMAPIGQYLMDELPRSRWRAAQHRSLFHAMQRSWFLDVMVSKRQSKGKNGFVCIVERSWTSALDADFWNPRVRTPICYDAAAAHSLLPRNIKRTELILAGGTNAQTDETIVAAVDKKELPTMEPGAMCYMMSKQGYGGDSVAHWPSHLMFFYSQTDPAPWGANLPGSPILMSDDHEHLTEFAVGVQRWSDGTEAH